MASDQPSVFDAAREIETVLGSQENVKQATCVTADDGQLAVILSLVQAPKGAVNHDDQRRLVTALRKKVRSSIRLTKIPKKWMIVDQLPVNGAGEVDIDQIKNLVGNGPAAASPSGGADKLQVDKPLQVAFARAHGLAVADVDLEKSFVEIGGDSISAIRVMEILLNQGINVCIADLVTASRLADVPLRSVDSLNSDAMTTAKLRSNFGVTSEWLKLLNKAPVDLAPTSLVLKLHSGISLQQVDRGIEGLLHEFPLLRDASHARVNRDREGTNGNHRQLDNNDNARRPGLHIHSPLSDDLGDPDKMETEVSKASADMLQRRGIFEMHLFEAGPGSCNASRLVLLAHALLLDETSWALVTTALDKHMGNAQQPVALNGKLAGKPNGQLNGHSNGHCSGEGVDGASLSSTDSVSVTGDSTQGNSRREDLPVAVLRHASIENLLASAATFTTAAPWTARRSLTLPARFAQVVVIDASHQGYHTQPIDWFTAALAWSYRETVSGTSPPEVVVRSSARNVLPTRDVDGLQAIGNFPFTMAVKLFSERDNSVSNAVRNAKDALRAALWDQLGVFQPSATSRLTENSLFINFEDHRVHMTTSIEKEWFKVEGDLRRREKDIAPPDFPSYAAASVAIFDNKNVRIDFSSQSDEFMDRWVAGFNSKIEAMVYGLPHLSAKTTLADYPQLPLTYAQLNMFEQDLLPAIGADNLANIQSVHPCTSVQEGILLSTIKKSGSYRIEWIVEASGKNKTQPVDAHRLREAWTEVVLSHDSLRSVFVPSVRDNVLYEQVVLRDVEPRVVDVPCLTNDALETLRVLPAASFADGEPCHQLSICIDEERRVFCKFEFSHAIVDGMSVLLLLRNLNEVYSKGSMTNPQYIHSHYLQYRGRMNSSIKYWKHYLGDIKCPNFPLLIAQAQQQLSRKSVMVEVPDVTKLHASCRNMGVTVATLTEAAWAMVLRLYTQSETVCFGSLSSGRDAPIQGLSSAIGVFVHLLVRRVDFTSTSTAHAFLKAVQADLARSLQHQDTPLAEIQAATGSSHAPLFNTIVSLVQDLKETESTGQDVIQFHRLHEFTPTEYPVALVGVNSETQFDVRVTYETLCLSDDQASSLAESLSKAITFLVTHSDKSPKECDLYSSHDLAKLCDWNSRVSAPMDACMHDLITAQARENPDLLAVEAHDGKMSYAELESRATMLAVFLQDHFGVKPETLVIVSFDKSLWAVVAMLAVLKSGAAFVPVDGSQPRDRLASIISDTASTLALTSVGPLKAIRELLKDVVEVGPELLDQIRSEYTRISLSTSVKPSNVAYVIFTSGSTGTPKGIVMTHSAICTSSRAQGKLFGLATRSRVLQFSAYTFDVSMFDIFTTLLHGGCVCVPSEHDRRNDLAGAIRRLRVNTATLTPTVSDLIEPEDVPGIKNIALGGEAISLRHVQRWQSINLHGIFGPAECSICAWNQRMDSSGNPTNIGKPMESAFWVTDPSDPKQLVPVGCIGELLVQGPLLARGYLNQPDNPAWIENTGWLPRTTNCTDKVYRTGDLVRFNHDGTLEYVGRMDSQVKYHGQRIELGEIEGKVAKILPVGINGAVELVTSSVESRQQLVLFIWPSLSDNSAETPARPMTALSAQFLDIIRPILETLPSQLPQYMVPSLVLPITGTLPTTTSGKIDRKSLRAIAASLTPEELSALSAVDRPGEDEKFTPDEELLRGLWGDVLLMEVSLIRRMHHFFRLGGDSVSATRLVTAARKKGLVLTVAAIFEHPILADLALHLERSSSTGDLGPSRFGLLEDGTDKDSLKSEVARLCSIDATQVLDVYPCTPLQAGLLALSLRYPTSYVGRIVYEIPRHIDIDRFQKAWEAVYRRHEILRTRFADIQTAGLVQVVVDGESIHWETSHDVNECLLVERATSLDDLYRPKVHWGLAHHADGKRFFVWRVHHSLYDAVTLTHIMQHVESIYGEGDIAEPVPFSKFVDHVQQKEEKVAAATFWKNQFENSNEFTFPASSVAAGETRIAEQTTLDFSVKLPGRTRSEFTLSNVIRAAWAVTLADFSNTSDVIFGVNVSGRNAPMPGIEMVVGPTTATVPIRVRFDQRGLVSEFLLNLQKQMTDMIPYEQTGIQGISRLGGQTANASSFQTLLVIQPAEDDKTGVRLFDTHPHASSGIGIFTYAVILTFQLRNDSADVQVIYDNSLLGEERMKVISAHFESIVEQILKAPDTSTIGELGSLTKPGRETISRWNRNYPQLTSTTTQELRLRELWAAVLKVPVDSIGANDGFFAFGADSITAMRLVGAAGRQGLSLTVPQVFENPTLRDMSLVMTVAEEVDMPDYKPFSLLPGASREDLISSISRQCGISDSLVEDAYPVTSLQEGFISLDSPQRGSYIAKFAYRLSADTARFKDAWERVLRLCANLRTRIVLRNDTAVQVVVNDIGLWEDTDGLNLSSALCLANEIEMGYGTPLCRYAVVDEPKGEKYFILVMHHAIFDGTSMRIIMDVLHRVYLEQDVSTASPLSFARFVKYAVEQNMDESTQYWKQQLHHATKASFPQLPRSAKGVNTRTGVFKYTLTSTRDSTNLVSSNVTEATILRASWAIILARYCDSHDVCFGTTVSGRQAAVPDLDLVSGPTAATVPVRVRLDLAKSAAQLLRGVQKQALDMIPHEQTGLENIAKISSDIADVCDFSSLFLIQPAEHLIVARDVDETMLTPIESGATAESTEHYYNYPLVLQCQILEDRTDLVFVYDSILLESQMRTIAQQFDNVAHRLRTLDDSRETPVANILLSCSPLDISQLVEWNRTEIPVVPEHVHSLVAHQASVRPYSPAVNSWDERFSYRELDTLSSNLAAHLNGLGVGSSHDSKYVLFCFGKSAWAVVTLLGILKAGAAFVPLNPQDPIERRQAIAQQVQAKLVITSEGLASDCSSLADIVLEVSRQTFSRADAGLSPDGSVSPSDVAYAIFTSGSTGTPKGVVMEHGSFSIAMKGIIERLGLGSDTRKLQFASFTFDAFLAEVFGTLIAGGTVCMPSDEMRMNNLTQAIQELDANWLMLTPTVARTIHPDDLQDIKALAFIGEAPSHGDLEIWATKTRIVNGYGPTETCVLSTTYQWAHIHDNPRCIGEALNCSAWVVDPNDHNKLRAIGCVGELVLQGPTLARGYLNNPEQTEAAFFTDPAWNADAELSPGSRFYKTGDLVRHVGDGALEFLGRKDFQIKINGQRVESSEVEHHFAAAFEPARDVLVSSIQGSSSSGKTVLVAFFTLEDPSETRAAREGIEPMTDSLRQELHHAASVLRTRLPRHMVPKYFFPIQKFPPNPSGKTSMKRLQDWFSALSPDALLQYALAESSPQRAPSSAMEKLLRELLAEVLEVDASTISADDNFLLKGGDSISAIRLVKLARDENVELSVGTIFDHPVLSRMAEMAGSRQANGDQPVRPFSLVGKSDGPARRALLERLTQECSVQIDEVEDCYPCTPLQEGLMALSSKQPGTYMAQLVFGLPEAVDLARFRHAWERMVASTAILRTRVVMLEQDSFLQVVLRQGLKWTSGNDLAAFLKQDLEDPMLLSTPLARYALIEGKKRRYFVWTAHHGIYDGWSVQLILDGVRRLYHEMSLPEATPFSHMVAYNLSKNRTDAANFWASQLEGSSPPAFPRLPSINYVPRARALFKHRFIAQRNVNSAATLPTVLKSAFALLLARYADSQDVVFGQTSSGRQSPLDGVESIVGPLIATIPVRLRLSRSETVSSFLGRVQHHTNTLAPFEQTGLQTISKLNDDTRRACQFQTLLVIQPNRTQDAMDGDPVMVAVDPDELGLESQVGEAFHTYALVFECAIVTGQVVVSAVYDQQVLSEPSIEAICHQFTHIVHQMLNPEAQALETQEITFLSNFDEQKIRGWKGKPPSPVLGCLHDFIENQAMATPEAAAISAWDATMSYEEFNAATTGLAYHLVASGVTVDSFVPICFEKSAMAIVSMIAIMKAGAAYVPLDPSHPIARQRTIMGQIGAQLILGSAETSSRCAALAQTVVEVNSVFLRTCVEQHRGNRQRLPTVSPRSAAYVLFTSGSTGTPKGLVMEHAGACTAQLDIVRRLRLQPQARVLQFAAFVFDLCISEIFAPLLAGACICIPSEHDRLNDIKQFIRDQRVDWGFLTPTFARILTPDDLPGLRHLVLAGEAVGQDILKTWVGKVQLWNGWGPSECCCFSTLHQWKASDESPLNLGRDVGGLCWIVEPDDHDKLVPLGCAGEIVIQGTPISREYLQAPDLTQAAFIDASPPWLPNAEPPHFSRIFKTGDLGRFNPDGTIEFIGRKDTQVKIRGFRVELGEIEHHIKAQSNAEQVAVEVVQTDHDERAAILVAYLCFSRSSGDISDDEFPEVVQPMDRERRDELASLNSMLATLMPQYMVPDVFVPLSRMPVITSTKLDRSCLRRLATSLSREQLASYSLAETLGSRREPATEVERCLAGIWSTVLKIPLDNIGRDDNFLKIGGDSISAIRLVAAAREEGIFLTVADIFSDPRLCQMSLAAKSIEDRWANGPGSFGIAADYVPFGLLDGQGQDLLDDVAQECGVTADQIEDAYPCTPLQDGMMALTAKQPGSYIATRRYRIPDTVDMPLFQHAWEDTVRACPNLRTRIVVRGNQTLQAIIKDVPQLQVRRVADLESSLAAYNDVPMGYGTPLCLYAIVQDQETGAAYFVWALHHSIYDGHSMQNMLRTFAGKYEGIDCPQTPPYATFIKYVLDIDADTASGYWMQQLQGARQASFPPHPRSDVRAPDATRCFTKNIPLGPMSGAGVTKASVLRTAWAVVLARYCDSNDVCFGVTVSGRNAPVPGVTEIMGPAVATIPVRINIDLDCPTEGFIQRVQDQAVEMTAYEQFGLQRISKLGPDAEDACRFSSLLVVQPAEYMSPAAGNSSSILLPYESGSLDQVLQDYFTFPLVVQCLVMPDDTVDLLLIYEADVLNEYQVSALASQLGHTIEQLTTLGERPLRELSVTGSRDLELASELNSETPEIIRSTYHQLVKEQARLQPTAVAVDAWDKTFTYSELDQAANRLAYHLVESGVRRGDFVPVCFEKSAWYIVSILAVNKAGAAWLPLEPTASQVSRQRLQIQQTGAKVALALPSTRKICEKLLPTVIEVTAALDNELGRRPHDDIALPDVSPADAAYILFTSGSTGTPKGLVMEHLAVCTSQTAVSRRLRLTPDVRILQFASYVFDLSVGELVAPLISGACICIPPEGARLHHHELREFVSAFRVSWAFFTPAFARILDPGDFPGLELLLLAGEAVTRDVFSKWFGRGSLRLVNGWGPAETCVFSTLHEYTSDAESTITIGRPVGGHCWVVESEDEHGFKLAPHGCVGEIIVHSPTVLREYLADEEKTRASVSTRPPAWSSLQQPPWNRCFRTGDLGFINGEGVLEYQGRKDTQVKIHGLRVELGEVEQQLYKLLPDARQVVVDVLRQEKSATLVAYFCLSMDTRGGSQARAVSVPNGGHSDGDDDPFLPITPQLKDQLNDLLGELSLALPRYMIPSLFIPCQHMPVITSTKIDRAGLLRRTGKLDQAAWESYSLQSHKREPVTVMERRLQRIWAELLSRSADSIGRDDAFLGIGGDSIMAIQLVAASRKQGIRITVQDVFRDSRLMAVSATATEMAPADSKDTSEQIPPFSLLEPSLCELVREKYSLQDQLELEDAYPCTALQEGLMSLAIKQPGSYVAKFSFLLPRHVDILRFKRAWEMTLQAHPSLRTRFLLCNDNTTVQTVVRGGHSWEDTNDLDIRAAHIAAGGTKVGYETAMCRFGIVDDPLGQKYFLWTIHHAIYDGLSLGTIMETLGRAYHSQEIPTSPSYSGFIKYTMDIDPGAAAEYWKGQLRGVKQASFPPRKRSGRGDETAQKTEVFKQRTSLTLPKGLSVTRASVFRAAWAIVLARYCNADDVCFGATISGRQAPVPGIEEMVGPMISTVPVRIRLGHGRPMTAKNFVQEVQNQALDMVPYEQYGLHNISRLGEDGAEACNFSSLFVIQPAQVMDLQFPTDGEEALLVPTSAEISEMGLQNYFSYPLVVQGHLHDSSADLLFIYDSQSLAATQVSAMARHFDHVMQQLQLGLQREAHDMPLSAISLAGEWDLQEAMRFNSDTPEIMRTTIHGLVEEQALRRPNAPAIEAWDGTFTYAQLNEAANRLAHHLVDNLNVQTGDLVHVLFHKSLWYFVAILAVNKAGAAWVPLEPSHPLERHQQVVRQTGSRLALASAENSSTCLGLVPSVVEVTPSLDSKLAAGNPTASSKCPQRPVGPSDAAYALFTSGSTGTPKGFVMEHGAVCTSQTAISRRLGFEAEKVRILQLASYVFDLSVGEIVAPLISGACVCVPSEDARLNDIGRFIRDKSINWAFLTPSFARTLAPEDVPGLELLLLAGEPVGYDRFNRWFGRVRLINGWGPAETVSTSFFHSKSSPASSVVSSFLCFTSDCSEVHRSLLCRNPLTHSSVYSARFTSGHLRTSPH